MSPNFAVTYTTVQDKYLTHQTSLSIHLSYWYIQLLEKHEKYKKAAKLNKNYKNKKSQLTIIFILFTTILLH